MSGCWRQKWVIALSFVGLLMLTSEASRLPNWEQMLPKKLPARSSAPSRGTNSVATEAVEIDRTKLPSSDGKV